LRISDDRRRQARQAIYTNPEPPVLVIQHGESVVGRPARFSPTAHV